MPAPYLLDTTVLLHWTRNSPQAQVIDANFQLSSSAMRPLVCEVSLGEMLAFSLSRSWGTQKRAHPDFPLRGFVRCQSCGRGLTGSWSKGRSDYYAYYHCRPGCCAVNVSKATLEGLFVDELALMQPTPGYMRLLKESVLRIWKARQAAVREEIATAERAAKAIQEELDRLDEAFLFERSIDIET